MGHFSIWAAEMILIIISVLCVFLLKCFIFLKMEKTLQIRAMEGNAIEVKRLLDRRVNANAVDPVSICFNCMYLCVRVLNYMSVLLFKNASIHCLCCQHACRLFSSAFQIHTLNNFDLLWGIISINRTLQLHSPGYILQIGNVYIYIFKM